MSWLKKSLAAVSILAFVFFVEVSCGDKKSDSTAKAATPVASTSKDASPKDATKKTGDAKTDSENKPTSKTDNTNSWGVVAKTSSDAKGPEKDSKSDVKPADLSSGKNKKPAPKDPSAVSSNTSDSTKPAAKPASSVTSPDKDAETLSSTAPQAKPSSSDSSSDTPPDSPPSDSDGPSSPGKSIPPGPSKAVAPPSSGSGGAPDSDDGSKASSSKDGDEVKKVSQKEVDPEGIDTIDIETGGNWLLKRVWWQKSVDTFEKIRTWLEKVLDKRMIFYTNRSNLDADLDAFYIKIGFERGGFDGLMDSLKKALDDIRQEQGALDVNERSLLQKISSKKNDLEALHGEIKGLGKLDKDIDDALSKLLKYVDQCRSYERDAWDKLKKIGLVLSDQQAKNLFYQVKGDLQNIQQMHNHITQAFASYFNQSVKKAKDKMTKIESGMKDLKGKGVDLQKQVETVRAKAEKEEQEDAVKRAEKEWTVRQKELADKKKKAGFIIRVKDVVVTGVSAAYEKVRDFVVPVVKKLYGGAKGLFLRVKKEGLQEVKEYSEKPKVDSTIKSPQVTKKHAADDHAKKVHDLADDKAKPVEVTKKIDEPKHLVPKPDVKPKLDKSTMLPSIVRPADHTALHPSVPAHIEGGALGVGPISVPLSHDSKSKQEGLLGSHKDIKMPVDSGPQSLKKPKPEAAKSAEPLDKPGLAEKKNIGERPSLIKSKQIVPLQGLAVKKDAKPDSIVSTEKKASEPKKVVVPKVAPKKDVEPKKQDDKKPEKKIDNHGDVKKISDDKLAQKPAPSHLKMGSLSTF
ncbi:hypothetical protein HN446_00825 [bacterium]|nr:hypothetical protein [bacterium]